jgi:hypothetical protein
MTLNSQRHRLDRRIGVSAQPGTIEASGRTTASNPLSELIKIYDNDESPEVSRVTPVHIEEEKGPEKTYSLFRHSNSGASTS